jgi:hypothetical protein
VPYTLFWELVAGKPRPREVVPFAAARTPVLPPLCDADPEAITWLAGRAPAPRRMDDGVLAQLWRVEPAVAGLPATIRCLTAWRRASRPDDGTPPEVLAAEVAEELGQPLSTLTPSA